MKDRTEALIQKITTMNFPGIAAEDVVAPPEGLRAVLCEKVFPPEKVESFLKTVTYPNSQAVVVSDPAGYIEWVSPTFTRMCGYSLEELRGQKAGRMLQGVDTDPRSVEVLRSGVREHKVVETDIVNYHKSGDRYEVRIGLWPLHDEHGQCSGFVALENQILR